MGHLPRNSTPSFSSREARPIVTTIHGVWLAGELIAVEPRKVDADFGLLSHIQRDLVEHLFDKVWPETIQIRLKSAPRDTLGSASVDVLELLERVHSLKNATPDHQCLATRQTRLIAHRLLASHASRDSVRKSKALIHALQDIVRHGSHGVLDSSAYPTWVTSALLLLEPSFSRAPIDGSAVPRLVHVDDNLRLGLFVNPGRATTAMITELLESLSDLHVALGGDGLVFHKGDAFVPVSVGVEA